jgi:glutamyl/glutaminyl-tRNA synthetase
VVIDDWDEGVTHVIRGEEHLSNTPRQILMQEALGAPIPTYAHLPLVLGEDKLKLSKRKGAPPLTAYRDMGYLPEAILNTAVLIGWNPGGDQEIFNKDELIKLFDLSKVQKAGAVFNPVKLDWVNKEHIKKLSSDEQFMRVKESFKQADIEISDKTIKKIIPIIIERINKWSDVGEMIKVGELDFFFKQPEYAKEKLIFKNTSPEKINSNLKQAIKVLENIDENDFTTENIKNGLMQIADSLESRGELLHPIRFALSGLDKSPDPFIIADILGKNETLSRLQKAI